MRSLVVLSMLLAAGSASAQLAYERAGTWEFGISATRVDSWHSDGEGGSALDVSGETGWGLFGAYNFTNRIAIQFDWSGLSPDYRATYVPENGDPPERISHTADIDNFHVKGTFYLLDRQFTPFLEAGLGWTRIDSNVLSAPPITGCWWDPWWGWRCAPFYSTYGANETSYSGAIGFRWDISPSMFLRGHYGIVRLDGSATRSDDKPNLYSVAFGWRF